MKYVRQFMLILMISFCGELLKCLLQPVYTDLFFCLPDL